MTQTVEIVPKNNASPQEYEVYIPGEEEPVVCSEVNLETTTSRTDFPLSVVDGVMKIDYPNGLSFTYELKDTGKYTVLELTTL